MPENQNRQCENLTCTNGVAYRFFDDLGEQTDICEACAKQFSEDMLEPIEVVA